MARSSMGLKALQIARVGEGKRLIRRHLTSISTDTYKKYADTLTLPKTSFKSRPSPSDIDQYIKETGEHLYKWQRTNLPASSEIVFHDGPPYANGELHLGHALNKTLKDIINRYHVIRGRRVSYVPGWDCHGLPIELAALEKAKKKLGSRAVQQFSIQRKRELAKELALAMSLKQKEGFKGFAIMADWEGHVYRTLTDDYVIRQLQVFKEMLNRKLISRQDRPVYWSVESGTALAESELQYNEHKTRTAIVKYPLAAPSRQIQDILHENNIASVSVAIWTTTPWTLVANRAIAINPGLEYGIVHSDEHGYVITEVSRCSEIRNVDETAAKQTGITFPGSAMLGSSYSCLLRGGNQLFPVLQANYVTSDTGTGLVHTAPGHGKDDYLMCKEHSIAPYSPIDDKGKYTSDLPESLKVLEGHDARKEGQSLVIDILHAAGAIVSLATIKHNIPYDWRSKTPVMVRSTPQFFADVGSIKERALKALDKVHFHPESGRNRLKAFTMSRSEWCISRQRVWGVPLPVVYHKETGDALMTPETVEHIIATIDRYDELGVAKWFEDQQDISEWLPATYDSSKYQKGIETMDVWFDSGTSWTMLQSRPNQPMADYYLEGSDQHRGWFQSSLLTRIALSNEAPFKTVVTHGFTLDEKGQKMSKSLKNVVTPQELINGGLGIDGMRLWIAQADYTTDISLSPVIVSQVGSLLKKLRVSYKFLLGNLQGYSGQSVSYDQLRPVDKRALSGLYELSQTCAADYEDLSFNRVVKRVQNHMSVELSAFYFDVVKDRLYADAVDSSSRLAVQFVLSQVLRAYISILAPVTPLLSQEVWHSCPDYIKLGFDSPFKAGWADLPAGWKSAQIDDDFEVLNRLRGVVRDAMEQGRIDKNIRSSLGSEVYLQIDEKDSRLHEKTSEYLPYMEEIFISSTVYLDKDAPNDVDWSYSSSARIEGTDVTVTVVPPTQCKCPRCWQFNANQPETLCRRCHEVVNV
jgi:isoleucyl-tRNA synthetase